MASAYVDGRYLTVNIAAGDQPNIVNTMGNRELTLSPAFPSLSLLLGTFDCEDTLP